MATNPITYPYTKTNKLYDEYWLALPNIIKSNINELKLNINCK